MLRRVFKPSQSSSNARPWPVLVVDDEPDVHAMTKVLLRDLRFKDRPFEVVSALSAAEARRILAERDDIPVVLLDVVMETPDAGLELVRYIREDLGNGRIAIVLRTGQPGEAPESEIMLAYDINDYRAKTELTAQKLFTALVGGLRSWTNLTTIEAMNISLEQRVEERTSQLDRARRFAENLVDMLPHPVWYKDGDGRLQMYNRAFRDMFGLPPGGSTMPPQLAALDRDSDAVVHGDGDLAFEATVDLTSGQRTIMISKGRLIEEAAGQPGTIGLITDITERKRMEHQLRKLATIDDLTGTLNRRAFFSAAELEIERAARYGGLVSVVMFDIDHFKQVNDRHGHAVGDQALRSAAAALRANLREIDILGRLGGEEFAALLPETGLDGAVEVAERLRAAVASIAFVVDGGGDSLRLTGSLGVAERRPDELTVDPVLARADAALYRSKETGRNRVSA
ncbi:sensor domain-containing diguanylate cyclase [Paramagnetospirillum kuznetsovii]|uniref:sensor domain-containing diguanylate cyclase n=1 Tax=Paramagnetospirillum kuznetsovii TaxID=2053833 RepID=UPI001EFC3057|nr:diguanylate cyclase [Paramagnetospirillum kuznetsovii]